MLSFHEIFFSVPFSYSVSWNFCFCFYFWNIDQNLRSLYFSRLATYAWWTYHFFKVSWNFFQTFNELSTNFYWSITFTRNHIHLLPISLPIPSILLSPAVLNDNRMSSYLTESYPCQFYRLNISMTARNRYQKIPVF